MRIYYKKGFKYQISRDYKQRIDIIGHTVKDKFYELTPIGVLFIFTGYASDGPSGPTLDTDDFMRGAFVHDVLYEMIRKGQLPDTYRKYADKLLKEMCIQDGMPDFRADYVYFAVRAFGESSADPDNKRKEYVAP